MQYEIEVGGRTRRVVVHRTGDILAVSIDGTTWQVDSQRIDAHTLSLLVGNGPTRSFEATITPEAAGRLIVRVGSTPIAVAFDGRRRFGRKDAAAHAGTSSGPQRIVAPMPGKIVRVLVAPGDTVGARQPLVVVEAMKMENELRAARAGTVTEVHAREGASVDAGTLLAVIT